MSASMTWRASDRSGPYISKGLAELFDRWINPRSGVNRTRPASATSQRVLITSALPPSASGARAAISSRSVIRRRISCCAAARASSWASLADRKPSARSSAPSSLRRVVPITADSAASTVAKVLSGRHQRPAGRRRGQDVGPEQLWPRLGKGPASARARLARFRPMLPGAPQQAGRPHHSVHLASWADHHSSWRGPGRRRQPPRSARAPAASAPAAMANLQPKGT